MGVCSGVPAVSDFITGFIVGFIGGVFALHCAQERFPDD